MLTCPSVHRRCHCCVDIPDVSPIQVHPSRLHTGNEFFVSQVAQLCRGLLQPDPVQRQGACEGQSVVSWFVSRLETADKDKRDAKGSCFPAETSRGGSYNGSYNVGPPVASGGVGDATRSVCRAESTCGASAGKHGRVGSAIAPVDMTTPSLMLGSTRVSEERGRDMRLPGDAGQGEPARGVRPERASVGLDTAVRRAPTEEERRLEEPDELVR